MNRQQRPMKLNKFDSISEFDSFLDETGPESWRRLVIDDNLKDFDDPLSKCYRRNSFKTNFNLEDCDAKAIQENRERLKSLPLIFLSDIYLLFNRRTRDESAVIKGSTEYHRAINDYLINGDYRFRVFDLYVSFLVVALVKMKVLLKGPTSNQLKNLLEEENIGVINKIQFLYILLSANNIAFELFDPTWMNNYLERVLTKPSIKWNAVYVFASQLDQLSFVLNKGQFDFRKILKKAKVQIALDNLDKLSYDPYSEASFLPQIRDLMDELKCYGEESRAKLNAELSRVGLFLKSGLKESVVELPEEVQNSLNTAKAFFDSLFDCDDSVLQLNRFFDMLLPFEWAKLERGIKEEHIDFLDLFKIEMLDDNGNVINYKTVGDNENLSIEVHDRFSFAFSLLFSLKWRSFSSHFKYDNLCREYVEKAIEGSSVVNDTEKPKILKYIHRFLEGNLESSIYQIILTLEGQLRYLIRKENLPVYKQNSSGDYIDLNYVLNGDDKNRYRDLLLRYISKDYYRTLCWLLTNKYGFNLRNKLAHDLCSDEISGDPITIFAVVLIIKFYLFNCQCGGQG